MDQWKMLALDSTPPEWKCDSRKAHPAIDEVWSNVLSRINAVGYLKYCTLTKVVKACLAFPHGNADAERSFSANKNTATAERSSVFVKTQSLLSESWRMEWDILGNLPATLKWPMTWYAELAFLCMNSAVLFQDILIKSPVRVWTLFITASENLQN